MGCVRRLMRLLCLHLLIRHNRRTPWQNMREACMFLPGGFFVPGGIAHEINWSYGIGHRLVAYSPNVATQPIHMPYIVQCTMSVALLS